MNTRHLDVVDVFKTVSSNVLYVRDKSFTVEPSPVGIKQEGQFACLFRIGEADEFLKTKQIVSGHTQFVLILRHVVPVPSFSVRQDSRSRQPAIAIEP